MCPSVGAYVCLSLCVGFTAVGYSLFNISISLETLPGMLGDGVLWKPLNLCLGSKQLSKYT